jgi:hypothetical protein
MNGSFEVGDLPGGLTEEEQGAVVDMLEDTGLFERVET